MQKEPENAVVLQGVPLAEARETIKGLGGAFEYGVVQLTPVDMYSFYAEYTVKSNDLIFHFYLPKQAAKTLETPKGRQAWMDYWLHRFAEKINVIAQEFFEATSPRLQVKYTEEVASWWFKAQGFGLSSDPALLAQRFLEKLDAALKERNQTPDGSS